MLDWKNIRNFAPSKFRRIGVKYRILLVFIMLSIIVMVVLENQIFLDEEHILVGSMLYLLWFNSRFSGKEDNNNRKRR